MSFPRMIRNVLKPDKKEFFFFTASSAEQGRAGWVTVSFYRALPKHKVALSPQCKK